MADDVELLRRYANERSEEAFTALVQQHLSLVYHAALRRTNGDTHLAEDVAQMVFANLAREAGALQRHAMLVGWLYVATRHAAANAMRSERRRKTREQEALTMSASSTPAVSGAEWEQLRPELDSVMDELNEADRNAVLLRFFENRPYAEIGASFRISEDAARMRVERALEKLRTLLSRRGITSTAALGGLLAAQSAVAAPAGLVTAVTGSVLAGVGVAAATSGTVGFITFMTTNKIMLGIAGTMVLVAGGTAVYEHREARQAEAALIGLSRDKADLQSQLVKKETQIREAEARAATWAKTTTEAGSGMNNGVPVSANKTGAAAKAVPASSLAGKMDILYSNPEYVQLDLQRSELEMRLQYRPLYRKLGLSEEQIHEFESLMIEQQQSMLDLLAAARAKGVSVNDPALQQLRMNDSAQATVPAKLQALLGPEGFEAYNKFTSLSAGTARASVDSLAMRLYSTTTPLTPEQADKLIMVIAGNTAKPTEGGGFMNEMTQPDWPVIYSQAKAFLSAPQITTLEASNRSMQISWQQSKLSDRLLQEAAANGGK
jgi:RNA polymerase sigma factor (sigma-70 family)